MKLKEAEEDCFKAMLNFMVAIETHLGATQEEAVEKVKKEINKKLNPKYWRNKNAEKNSVIN